MKLPAINLYPGDWLRDQVAGCSLAAQGLWLRMMFLMHDSERYGYLQRNRRAIPEELVARLTGADSVGHYRLLLAELDCAGIPSRTSEGVIFCRRMVKDAKAREQNKLRVRDFRKRNASVMDEKRFCNPPLHNESENENEIPPDHPRKGDRGKPKRLHGIPATVEEVIAAGKLCNPPKDEATCRAFWAHYEGQARTSPNGDEFWVTSGEAIVTKWREKLAAFEGRSINGVSTTKPLSIMDIKTVIAAKEVAANKLKNQFCVEAPTGDEWTDKEKREVWRKYRSEIKKLTEQLSQMA